MATPRTLEDALSTWDRLKAKGTPNLTSQDRGLKNWAIVHIGRAKDAGLVTGASKSGFALTDAGKGSRQIFVGDINRINQGKPPKYDYGQNVPSLITSQAGYKPAPVAPAAPVAPVTTPAPMRQEQWQQTGTPETVQIIA